MFAYVKYVDDNTCKIVPTSFVAKFNVKNWSSRNVYRVYWTPKEIDEKLSPPGFKSLEERQEDGSGYYKAVVLKLAGSKEEMAEQIKKSRVKFVSSKLIKDDQALGEEGSSSVDFKKQELKAAKLLKKKGSEINTRELFNLGKNSAPTKDKKPLKRSLFESASSSDSEKSLLDNSDDDVIPKKLYKQLQKKFDEYKKVENEKYATLLSKYRKVNARVEKLTELNIALQSRLLEMPMQDQMSSSTHQTNISKATGSRLSLFDERTISITPSYTKKPLPIRPISSPVTNPIITSQSADPITSPSLSLQNENENLITEEPLKVDEEMDVSKSALPTMPDDKLILAKQVKRGKAGDSQYAKNLAALLWDGDTLEKRSVTGRKCNAQKGSEAKKMLTPQKMEQLRTLFRDRIYEENNSVSKDEVELRCANINQYIAQKIATLNRRVKQGHDDKSEKVDE